MDTNFQVRKTVYNKENFNKLVNREFTTFTQPESEPEVDEVAQFFESYDRLFYSIPAEGDVNSHRYLVEKSSELVDFEKTTEEIQPLLDEIALLREQLLTANQNNFELQQQLARRNG